MPKHTFDVWDFEENTTFGTLFFEVPKTRRFQPSIAFRGAKHCFSPEKALLSSK